MFNRATFQIVGRIGSIRPNKEGTVRYISIASSYDLKVEGKWERRTRWNDVKVLDKSTIARIDKAVGVGDLVIFEGILQRTDFKNREGVAEYSQDVILKEFIVAARKGAAVAVPPAAAPAAEPEERPVADADLGDQPIPPVENLSA